MSDIGLGKRSYKDEFYRSLALLELTNSWEDRNTQR